MTPQCELSFGVSGAATRSLQQAVRECCAAEKEASNRQALPLDRGP